MKKVTKKMQQGGDVKKDSTSTTDKVKRAEDMKELLKDLNPYQIKKYSPPMRKKGGTTKSKK